ncbi:unnamed protein product [Meloidogyne enterolobii]|uniref:Uncharacterized protein n=1 Tax=Meloidogyne enterolobii TaxID=390850 RepID=A0ACB0YUS8_MELEN
MHPQAIVYNHELMETEQIREGVTIQPQIREFYIQYSPPGTSESVGESSQQASGRRRHRNGGNGNGGNGSGGNGNGGNGHRGGGRRRINGGRGGNGNDGN